MAKIFDILHCVGNTKVDYATYMLLGEAEDWWQGARRRLM
jgi:hypothetical protein